MSSFGDLLNEPAIDTSISIKLQFDAVTEFLGADWMASLRGNPAHFICPKCNKPDLVWGYEQGQVRYVYCHGCYVIGLVLQRVTKEQVAVARVQVDKDTYLEFVGLVNKTL